jgi:hypothetical protein
MCPITHRPARYFDPLTKCPYADAAAFKQLRARWAQMLAAQAKKAAKLAAEAKK